MGAMTAPYRLKWLPPFSCQDLRRSFISGLLDGGVDIGTSQRELARMLDVPRRSYAGLPHRLVSALGRAKPA
jgi:hypothetical protein